MMNGQMFIAYILHCKEVGTQVIIPFLEGHMQVYNLLEKKCVFGYIGLVFKCNKLMY
jgi:hypothetical protein